MSLFLQILMNSLITGSVYGVMAMSFSLSYRATRFFNLAHGAMAAVGGYTFLFLSRTVELPLIVKAGTAMLTAGLAGYLIDLFVYAPQRKRKASGTVLLVVSLGVLTVIEALISMAFSTQFQPLGSMVEIKTYQILGASLSQVQVWIIGFNLLVFVGLMTLLMKTKLGQILRAISDDIQVANILGLRTNFFIGFVFFISSVLAGTMGVLTGLDTGLTPTMGAYLLFKGIIAAIIGCVVSIPGAFLGAYFLALIENTAIWFLPSEWRDAVAFLLLLIFLILRPEGLLGKKGD